MTKRSPKCRALIAIVLPGCAMAAACNPVDSVADPDEGAEEPVLNLPAVPRPAPPIDRTGLLGAVARAASAAAAGLAAEAGQRQLDGRPFELRIRFGCRGPAPDLRQAWLGWSYDAEKRTIRVRAAPTIGAGDPLVASLEAGEVEAVEGFWIPRPWLLDPVCPGSAPAAAPTETAESPAGPERRALSPAAPAEPVPRSPRIGIAQFFTATDPRTGRRDGRAYEAVENLPEGRQPGSDGFVLVLSGRLRAIGSMGVIGCTAQSRDAPPECIVSADFDRVSIEEPESRREIAEWSGS